MDDTIASLTRIRDDIERQEVPVPQSSDEAALMIWRRELLEQRRRIEALDRAIATVRKATEMLAAMSSASTDAAYNIRSFGLATDGRPIFGEAGE